VAGPASDGVQRPHQVNVRAGRTAIKVSEIFGDRSNESAKGKRWTSTNSRFSSRWSLFPSSYSLPIANAAIHLLIVALRCRVPVKLVPVLREKSQRNAEAERIRRDGSQSSLRVRGRCIIREHHRQVSENSYRSDGWQLQLPWKRNHHFTHPESSL